MRLWSKLAAAAAVVSAVVAGGSAAHAQTPVNPLLPTTGTREIGVNGNFVFEPTEFYNLELLYGPFLNPNLQVGGTFGFSDAEGSDSTFTVGAFANYHFPSASAALPFVGVLIGYADSGDDDSFTYGVQGGVKYFLNPNVSVNGTLRYLDQDDDEDFRLLFGISAYLR